MRNILLAVLGATVLMAPIAAQATPEQDRQQLQDFYKSKFPQLKPADYVHGALALDPDAMAQYDSIMDFPPYGSDLEKSKKMWETPFKNGQTYASCLPNGGKNIAGNYPRFDDKLGKVVTFEMELNACREKNGETPLDYSDMKTMGLVTAYGRSLSDGMLMNVKVEGPGATAAYEEGKKQFNGRRGQLNFACATCHVQNGGNRIRSELLSPAIGQSTHWPAFRGGDSVTTLQARYVQCNRNIRAVPFKPGSEEYNNLEYFHSYISNGLPLQSSVYRK